MSTAVLAPPMPYFGSKQSLASQIVAAMGAHETYVEPFAGSCAVLLAKPRARVEIVSDVDSELINFWRVLRERPAELERVCALTPHSRAELAIARADDTLPTTAAGDLERARRFWVRATQARAAGATTGWRTYNTGTAMGRVLAGLCDRIGPVASRLAGVGLECRPAAQIIVAHSSNPDALLYVDPPYLGATRASGTRYANEMRDTAEHVDLAHVLRRARATVLLSGHDSDLYDDLYSGWHRRELTVARRQSNATTAAAGRVEVLWSNRPFPYAQPELDLTS